MPSLTYALQKPSVLGKSVFIAALSLAWSSPVDHPHWVCLLLLYFPTSRLILFSLICLLKNFFSLFRPPSKCHLFPELSLISLITVSHCHLYLLSLLTRCILWLVGFCLLVFLSESHCVALIGLKLLLSS